MNTNDAFISKNPNPTGNIYYKPFLANGNASRLGSVLRKYDSFTYSPDGKNLNAEILQLPLGSPLQEFMRSHTTNQMVKYQKIIEEQSRKMLEFQVDLDEEKTETLFLRQEVEKLQAERNKLKHSLEDAKQNLFRQSNLSFNER